jgi:hypothetical protein
VANEGTLELIVVELTRMLDQLDARLQAGELRALLAELGYPITAAQEAVLAPPAAALASAIAAGSDATRALIDAIDSGDSTAIVQHGTDGALALVTVVRAMHDLADAISAAGLPNVTPAEIAELPDRLIAKLAVDDMPHGMPELLELAGVLERTIHNENSTDPGNPEFTIARFDVGRALGWVQDAAAQLRDLYDWGEPTFDGSRLLPKLEQVIAATGLPVVLLDTETPPRLDVVLFELSAPPTLDPRGLLVGFRTRVNAAELQAPNDEVQITLSLSLAAPTGSGLSIQPNGNVQLVPPDPLTEITGEIQLTVTTSGEPYVLLGETGGSRAELGGVGLTAGTRLVSIPALGKSTGTFKFEARADRGKILIDASKGDGFLTTIIPGAHVEGAFDLTLGYSSETGFYLGGSSSLQVRLPLHIQLGPIAFQALTITVAPTADHLNVGLGGDISTKLGPIDAVVANMGIAAAFSSPSGGGNLGPLQADIGFLAPEGVGLALDVGIISGGGFLSSDKDRGEYAGALDLRLSDVFAVQAIGFIGTRMPDGSKGFSFLIIMSVDFGPGIQIGFGFTLLKVGGLLALNRTVKLQALIDGVRSGAVASIMFPQDIIANAPRIISDLRTFFPPQIGTFLIGPMAQLGWGTPRILTVSIGVIIEIPGEISIVGVIRIALPTEETAIVLLQATFVGRIEFDKARMYFFAALFESRVVFLPLEGEMGLLASLGDDANLIVTIGGFHPRFRPPPLPFPSPKQLEVTLLDSKLARVRIEGYVAITPNTAQFGARAEVFFGLEVLNVEGHISVDALFQFLPYHYVADFSGSLSVKVFGAGLFSVDVKGTFDGPLPWHIKGHGSISLLFWDIDVDFDQTWGDVRILDVLTVAVLPLLLGEIEKADNWRALIPAANNLRVSLRPMHADETALKLHPLGVLRISQRAMPLELTLDRIGNRVPSDVNRLSIAVLGSGLHKQDDALEQFAPAQYQNFSDADKLSKPAFESDRSGVHLSSSGDDLRSSRAVKRILRYEEIIIDSNFKRFRRGFRGIVGALFELLLNGAVVTRCPLSQAVQRKRQPFAQTIAVAEETYTVALQSNNTAFAPDAVAFISEAGAREYMNRKIAEDPTLVERVHVIPSYERAA